METQTKRFIEQIQTEVEFNVEFTDAILFCTKRYRRIERNRTHYILFTPIWKQIWHRIRGIKPYEDLNYEPKL